MNNSRLKNLREMLNLTQADLAEDLGISRQSLISLEQGKCKPSINLASEIAEFFEMPIELIFPQTAERQISRMPWSELPAFQEFSRLHEEIEELFANSFSDKTLKQKSQDSIKISIPLAWGINPKKIKTRIEKDELVIELNKRK